MSKLIITVLSLFYFSTTTQAFNIKTQCALARERLEWIYKPPNLPKNFSSNFIDLFRGSFEKLGEGAFGVVKEVSLDKGKKVNIAVKRVEIDKTDTNELQLLSDLSGLNISPNFFACNRDATYLYLAQDALHENLDHASTLTLVRLKGDKELLAFFKSLFDALFTMFDKDWVHNDLKPANLMTDELLQKIFLIDFGLGQKFGGRNNFGGTPLFMSFTRRKESKISRMSDLYAAALSIAVMVSSNDKIFYTVSEKGGYSISRMPNGCYITEKPDRWGRMPVSLVPKDKLHSFCVNNLRANVIGALKKRFGPYVSGATDENINFTTLMAWIIEYEFREGITADLIKKKLSVIAKKMKIEEVIAPEAPPRLVFEQLGDPNDEKLQESRALNTQRGNILNAINEMRGEAEKILDMDEDQLKILEDRYKEMWDALNTAERAHVHHSNIYQDNRELFNRQIVAKMDKEPRALKPEVKLDDRIDKPGFRKVAVEKLLHDPSDKAFQKKPKNDKFQVIDPLKNDKKPLQKNINAEDPVKLKDVPDAVMKLRGDFKPKINRPEPNDDFIVGKPFNVDAGQVRKEPIVDNNQLNPKDIQKYAPLRMKGQAKQQFEPRIGEKNVVKIDLLNQPDAVIEEAERKHQERMIKFIKPAELEQLRKNVNDIKQRQNQFERPPAGLGAHNGRNNAPPKLGQPLYKKYI